MKFEQIMENWKKFQDTDPLNEIARLAVIDKAKRDGGNPNVPTPFIGHNYRTANEIVGGSIELTNISDDGIMFFLISPFDVKKFEKNREKNFLGSAISGQATPGKYELALKFVNWDEVVNSDLSIKEKVASLVKNDLKDSDDIQVHCTCPSFRFHYQDVSNRQGASIESPTVGSKGIANPEGRGIVCKHTRRIVQVFPAYNLDIARKILQLERS